MFLIIRPARIAAAAAAAATTTAAGPPPSSANVTLEPSIDLQRTQRDKQSQQRRADRPDLENTPKEKITTNHTMHTRPQRQPSRDKVKYRRRQIHHGEGAETGVNDQIMYASHLQFAGRQQGQATYI